MRKCGCGAPITRHAKTARCADCANAAKRKGSVAVTDGLTVEGDKGVLSAIVKDNPRTLEELVAVCGIDLLVWTVDRWVANKWESVRGDATVPLFQVKAWLSRNRPLLDATTRIKAMIDDAKNKMPSRPRRSKARVGTYALEVSIPDLHLGKLAWSPETGYADYDLKIAVEVYEAALEALIQRTRGFAFQRILFPIGNDLFHSDTKQGTTTRGTPLDTDSRYHKAFLTGRRLITRAVDRLRGIAPVDVYVVAGNHSVVSEFQLGDSLECWFHKTDDVVIHNAPCSRKYAEFGANMILYTHGDKGSHKNLPLLMATEQREMFGRTTFREAHVGHLHQTRLLETMGVRVRISPALCPPDAWHSENQFVGNLQGAEAFVWDRSEGLVATAHYTVKPQ